MLKNYLITAMRNMMRQKVFSIINIAGLALSITAIWVIGLFVADDLSYDRYHKNAERIYRLASHGQWGEEKFDITGTSGLAAAAFKNDFPEVENAVRIDVEGGGIINYGDKTIKDDAVFFTDPSFFSVFTYHFEAGSADALQQPNSIVLTKTLAAKLFTRPVAALNKTVYIDKTPNLVTGVIDDIPKNFHFTFNALRAFPKNYQGDWGNLNIYPLQVLYQNIF